MQTQAGKGQREKGAEERRYQRVRPTGVMAKTATIVPDGKPSINCNVVDYSVGGACLDLAYEVVVTLPKRFELLYAGNRKKCRVVWVRGRRLGVCF